MTRRKEYINHNLHFDRVFVRIGKGCRGDADPAKMNADELAREFERLAGELQVVPPDDVHAMTGHAFLVGMLERASVITRGLGGLPDAFKAVDHLGRIRGGRR